MAKTVKNLKYYEAVGRRKEAVARVRLYIPGKDKTVSIKTAKFKVGDIVINDKPIKEYFPSEAEHKRFAMPLSLTGNDGRFVVSIKLAGGGKNGQIEAAMLGIARAVEISNEESRPVLKQAGLLTRDPRTRERRKVGTGGRARRAKQSPKR